MVKYIIATLQAMVGAKPTGPTDKIHERPTFSTVCHLQIQLVDGLRKLVNFKFPLDSHSGCILLKEAFSLFSSKEWKDPEEVDEYYGIPVTAIIEIEQQTKEKVEGQKREERDFQEPEDSSDKDF